LAWGLWEWLEWSPPVAGFPAVCEMTTSTFFSNATSRSSNLATTPSKYGSTFGTLAVFDFELFFMALLLLLDHFPGVG